MNAPPDLGDAGRAAFAEAVSTLESIGEDPALCRSAVEAYARTRDDVAKLRAAWALDGCPEYGEGSTGQLVVHPMVKGIHDAEKVALELGKAVGVMPTIAARPRGQQPGSARAEDRRPGSLRKAA